MMKNIFKLFILGTGIASLTACSDFLDQTSPSEMTDETVFNSAAYTENALNKVYAGLTLDHTYGARIPLNFSTNSDIELVDGLDNTGSGNSVAVNERGAGNFNPSSSWTKLDDNWSECYEIIENANIVVEGIENSSLIAEGNSSRAKMLRYKGEALALRAMIYFDLIRNYGDVPMKFETTKSDGSNIYLPKTDRDAIMEHLITDLEEAIDYLPWAGESSYTTERITKGFAHGLLARIAMSYAGYSIRESSKAGEGYETLANSDATYPTQRPGATKRTELYTKALTHLDAIIASGTHQLNPSIENEWYLINQQSLDQTYRENIFEVAHGLNYSGEMGYTVGVRLSGVTTTYGYGNSSGKIKLTAPFLWSFDKDDLRRDLTCATYEIKPGSSNEPVETMQSNSPFAIYVAKWDPRKMSDSWRTASKAATTKFGYGINWIVLRYADVLLMYAEALNELQGADVVGPTCGLTAREALLKVRSRSFDSSKQAAVTAYVNAIGSGSDFFNALVDERAWELAGEAVRKYDLIRWGLLDSKITESKEQYMELITKAPASLYYKMKSSDANAIDMSSICWYEAPANVADYKSVTGWGGEDPTNGKNVAYLPYISWGLNRVVKNRHLLPLGATTISDSKGSLKNSYGFE